MSAHLSSSARRTEARPVGYRSLASERCFRATSRRRTTLRSPNSRLGRGNVDRHRDRGNDDEIVHALAVHRAECADDQLCERGQERTRQEQPKSRSAPPRRPRTGPRKLEAKSRILFELPHAERFSNDLLHSRLNSRGARLENERESNCTRVVTLSRTLSFRSPRAARAGARAFPRLALFISRSERERPLGAGGASGAARRRRRCASRSSRCSARRSRSDTRRRSRR